MLYNKDIQFYWRIGKDRSKGGVEKSKRVRFEFGFKQNWLLNSSKFCIDTPTPTPTHSHIYTMKKWILETHVGNRINVTSIAIFFSIDSSKGKKLSISKCFYQSYHTFILRTHCQKQIEESLKWNGESTRDKVFVKVERKGCGAMKNERKKNGKRKLYERKGEYKWKM